MAYVKLGEPPIHIDEYLTDDDLASQYPNADAHHDGILFEGLRERIASSKREKVLIVLHTSTSHGPKYADKYPKEFEVFKPVARNVEEGEKNVGLLVNAYDNTIVYTDFLLNGLINTLRSMNDWQSAMIFISDHGESLGENNMFMHGLPMSLAPKVQYEIPFPDGPQRTSETISVCLVSRRHRMVNCQQSSNSIISSIPFSTCCPSSHLPITKTLISSSSVDRLTSHVQNSFSPVSFITP